MPTIDEVYRDFNTVGIPSSGDHEPVKAEIRALLKSLAGGTSAVGDYRGAWDSVTDYIATDLVEDGGSIWYALAPSTNVTPVEGATWTLFLPGASVADGTITNVKVAPAAGITSDKLSYTAVGTPAATPAIITNRLGQRRSVIDWGADPTGVADSTAAFENAALAAIDRAAGQGRSGKLLIPEGKFYLASRVDINTQLSILGEGAGSTVIGIDGNYQAFGLHNSASRWDQGEIGGFAVYCGQTGTHGLEAGILIDGDEYFNSYSFHDLMFAGIDNGIWFTGANPAIGLGEVGVNFNLFDRIRTTNIGARQTDRAIRMEQGSGTGNVFQNMSLIVGGVGVSIGNGNTTYNVGDLIFSNLHVGGGGVGIQLIGSSDFSKYHSTVLVDACQFDAGLSVGLQFTKMNQFQARNCNWGGAVSNQFIDCDSYEVVGAGGGDVQVGVVGRVDYTYRKARTSDIAVVPNNPAIYAQREEMQNAKQGVAAGAVVNMFSIDLDECDYGGCYVEITSFGLQQGAGGGLVTTKYHLFRAGGAPTVTQLENYAVNANLTHSTTIAGNVVTLRVTTASSGSGSDIGSVVDLRGNQSFVKRL